METDRYEPSSRNQKPELPLTERSMLEGTKAAECPQRRDLLGFAGVAALGTTVLLSACKRRQSDAEDDDGEVTANEDLMREHGVLRRILILYREVAARLQVSADEVDAGAINDATRLFQDFGERYHEQLLEEQHIFPILREAGADSANLVDILLSQHQRGRAITSFVLDRTGGGRIAAADAGKLHDALLSFARMYEAHAAREDTMIFPAFKAAVGQNAYRELGQQFEEIEHKQFGGDGFDIALAKMSSIEARLGLDNLARFTAPAPQIG